LQHTRGRRARRSRPLAARRVARPLALALAAAARPLTVRRRRPPLPRRSFLTFFKTLEGQTVTVELKNDLQLRGTLSSVDQYLNLKLADARVVDAAAFPQLAAVSTVFVRGTVVRYVHVPPAAVDTELLQDAARKEAMEAAKGGKR